MNRRGAVVDGRGTILPGAVVGIVGGGQLGRMLAAVAQLNGYHVSVLAPEAAPPAAVLADHHRRAAFDDVAAVRDFAATVDVLTFEFENVSSAALEAAASVTTVRPAPSTLYTTQNRAREKAFLASEGLAIAPYVVVSEPSELQAAITEVGPRCLVKTAGFGYDGKGQVALTERSAATAYQAALELAEVGPVVVEKLIDLELELSVVAARSPAGEVATFAPTINRHVDQVLDLSFTPAADDPAGQRDTLGLALSPHLAERATAATRTIAEALGLEGVCCVEFFLSRTGELLVNEIAPRPHNSGHLTIEAAATDQFEQQLRAVCGLPLGSTKQLTSAAMVNLLGDLWQSGQPDFAAALAYRGVNLHLYGKDVARAGRKMGHLTATGPDVGAVVATAMAARSALVKPA